MAELGAGWSTDSVEGARLFAQGKHCAAIQHDLNVILDAIRDILTSNGRTLVQGAPAWIWARSEKTIPIPGFKTVAQMEENAKAMEVGPLTTEQMQEIDAILGR